MFESCLDRSMTKNEIRDELLFINEVMGGSLSKSQANNYADKIKKGKANLKDLQNLIGYSDPTGTTATNRVMRERGQILLTI